MARVAVKHQVWLAAAESTPDGELHFPQELTEAGLVGSGIAEEVDGPVKGVGRDGSIQGDAVPGVVASYHRRFTLLTPHSTLKIPVVEGALVHVH